MRSTLCSALVVVLLLAAACAKAPATLTPVGVLSWQANQAVVAIGTVQHAAIQLNDIDRCDPTCVPLLSDANTRLVVDISTAAFNTIRAVPSGWKATTLAALEQMAAGLDTSGRTTLAAYVQTARTIVEGLAS